MIGDAIADPGAPAGAFAAAVVDGLGRAQKTLPCEYFYDACGSALFEKITGLPEYYLTRTEIGILERCVADIASDTPPDAVLIEFGSGSSRKTEILLRAFDRLAAYVPLDVSVSALDEARTRLAARFPDLRVQPVVGDFRAVFDLPADLAGCPRLGFFPGSTIGNFAQPDAAELLRSMRQRLGPGARFVVGVDLRKPSDTLLPAYNDAAGVTADFNKNLLMRANRELGANFDLDAFRHEAIFNDEEGCIEMHLVSQRPQTVSVRGHHFAFEAGETIFTESSYKYAIDDFIALAEGAGWRSRRVWTDSTDLFSVHEFAAGL